MLTSSHFPGQIYIATKGHFENTRTDGYVNCYEEKRRVSNRYISFIARELLSPMLEVTCVFSQIIAANRLEGFINQKVKLLSYQLILRKF